MPTEVPTETPTDMPTEVPTDTPTEMPTEVPTDTPTDMPTEVPTGTPTEMPTEVPTATPTEMPTEVPTDTPTEMPIEVTCPPSETLEGLKQGLTYQTITTSSESVYVVAGSGVQVDVTGHGSLDGAGAGADSITMFIVDMATNERTSFGQASRKASIVNPYQYSFTDAAQVKVEFDVYATGRDEDYDATVTFTGCSAVTETPTEMPTEVPTNTPTEMPTEVPTDVPTENPTEVPTENPTE